MFLQEQPIKFKENYFQLLKAMGTLSNLYSDSKVPYLYYRGHENAFCKAFEADNLSRSDVSADASKGFLGIGLKTFLNNNGKTFQKVAEFNKKRAFFSKMEDKPKELAKAISEMRNKRLDVTKSLHGLENMIYHCVTRTDNKFYIFEEIMDAINIDDIDIIKNDKVKVLFSDGLHEYNFNYSKSTLFKKFNTKNYIDLDVQILDDPFKMLLDFINKMEGMKLQKEAQTVSLPLFSLKGKKHVPEKSGLNQWNAGGRKRSNKEVYIPVPVWIHKRMPDFFPARDKNFNLYLPDKKVLSAKICQENGKALMSNPNTALGDWLIDDVLKVEEGKIVTYEMLEDIGIDSVEIEKIDNENFLINFTEIGSYEKFHEQNNK